MYSQPSSLLNSVYKSRSIFLQLSKSHNLLFETR
uniref:Uncharacterized protein n=1 Tax=Arundo donax TaxID=35708 RepID=A0A0A9FQI2_ARUDO